VSATLNNITTGNAYTATNSVYLKAVRVNVQVYNAAVFLQHTGWDQSVWQEGFLAPGKYSFDRKVLTSAFRSAVAGTPGQVTCEMLALSDLGGQ